MTIDLRPALVPEEFAKRLMRAKFKGRIPESITPMKCMELMLEFSRMQTMLAQSWEKIAQEMSGFIKPPFIQR